MEKADKENKEIAERETYELLEQQKLEEAIRVMVKCEASQDKPRGLGIDWKNYEATSLFTRKVETLKDVFNATPAILINIDENQLKRIRLAAGMMQLWGARSAWRWLPEGVDKAVLSAWAVASRMLEFHAIHLRRMEDFRDAGIRNVQVMGIADSRQCPECKDIDGKLFKLEDAPELPYAKCTCEDGCRCILVAEDHFWKKY
jgi:hypothetical protein